jgi:hypothetical protein
MRLRWSRSVLFRVFIYTFRLIVDNRLLARNLMLLERWSHMTHGPPNLQRWTKIANRIPFGSSLVKRGLPAALCPQIQKRCTGPNLQLDNTASCIYRLESKPTGDFNEAWGDNMVCRMIHFRLTIVRIEVSRIERTLWATIAGHRFKGSLSTRWQYWWKCTKQLEVCEC